VSNAAPKAGESVTITGSSNIKEGTARIELARDANSPFVPPHVLEGVPIHNGTFQVQDVVPSQPGIDAGVYRVLASSDDRYAISSFDVSFATDRVTSLRFNPEPAPAGTPIEFSADVP